MSVICSKCGCADVLCEAMINPNTKVFENYTDESFLYGWCNVCQTGRTLTDVEDVKAIIDNNFSKFCEKNGCEPGYVICTIVWKDDNGCVGEVIWHDSLNPDTYYDGWKVNERLTIAGLPTIRRIAKEESVVWQAWQNQRRDAKGHVITPIKKINIRKKTGRS